MRTRTARRSIAALSLALAGALLLAGCSTGGGAGDTASPQAPDSAFPVTVQGAYGDVTVNKRPERIVALDTRYLDFLDSLGVPPVATGVWGVETVDQLGTECPWLKGVNVGTMDPEMFSSAGAEVVAEAVAVHQPDLILVPRWPINEETYRQLAQIAPTYVPAGEGAQALTWDADLQVVGTLVGEAEKARQAVAEVNEAFDQAREALPGLQGATIMYGRFADNQFGMPADLAYWKDLGFEGTEAQAAEAVISIENIDKLADADLLAIFPGSESDQKTLESDPRFQQLPAVQSNSVIWIDDQTARAKTWTNGPRSMLWAIGQDRERLANLGVNQ